MRRKLIVGNWKMNGSLAALAELDPMAAAAANCCDVDVGICPPFTLVAPAAARAPSLAIGGQDCHAAESGAHTGCVSVPMLKEAGAKIAITGHSERRADQHESNEDVRAKALSALSAGLLTIVCVGESAAQRDADEAVAVVTAQLAGSVPDETQTGELVVAYEPIWAIGTGKVATPADVAEMHTAIRAHLRSRFGAEGEGMRILYGGSVKADNAAELFAVPDVDGALVGGASLTAAQFVPIIEAAASAK